MTDRAKLKKTTYFYITKNEKMGIAHYIEISVIRLKAELPSDEFS
jgi:hypothetical protein